MYADGELQCYNQSWLQSIDNLSTDTVGACTSRTADSIFEFLVEVYTYLVHMPLPPRDKWKEAYAQEKYTDYILFILKLTKEYDEDGIRKIHEGY